MYFMDQLAPRKMLYGDAFLALNQPSSNHPAGMHDNQICSTMLYFTMIVKTTLDSSKCRSVKTDV